MAAVKSMYRADIKREFTGGIGGFLIDTVRNITTEDYLWENIFFMGDFGWSVDHIEHHNDSSNRVTITYWRLA